MIHDTIGMKQVSVVHLYSFLQYLGIITSFSFCQQIFFVPSWCLQNFALIVPQFFMIWTLIFFQLSLQRDYVAAWIQTHFLILKVHQIVIRYTVGKITPIQRREVRNSDFGPQASFWMNFPKEGSQLTPPHHSEDFKWKDYCPMVFRLVTDFHC